MRIADERHSLNPIQTFVISGGHVIGMSAVCGEAISAWAEQEIASLKPCDGNGCLVCNRRRPRT